MKHQRLVYVLVICVMAAVTACTHPAGSPPPSSGEEPRVIEEPRSGTPKSENEYFYFLATQSERRAGHADRAIVWLQKAIEMDPDSAYLRRELAAIFLQNKEENKALEVLDELLAKHPEDVKGLILYGGIQQLRKQNDAAIRAYEKVTAIDPSQEKIYALLGGLYLESNQLHFEEVGLKDHVSGNVVNLYLSNFGLPFVKKNFLVYAPNSVEQKHIPVSGCNPYQSCRAVLSNRYTAAQQLNDIAGLNRDGQ